MRTVVLDKELFLSRIAYLQNDFEEALHCSKHSCINHHVEGLTYVCLARTAEMTLKLYLISPIAEDKKEEQLNAGFIVYPHNHKYNFDTIVLDGQVNHHRFTFERDLMLPGEVLWEQMRYSWRRKEVVPAHHAGNLLEMCKPDLCKVGDIYRVNTSEYHSISPAGKYGCLLGLVQYSDSLEGDTDLFKPVGEPFKAEPFQPMDIDSYHMMLNSLAEIIRNGSSS